MKFFTLSNLLILSILKSAQAMDSAYEGGETYREPAYAPETNKIEEVTLNNLVLQDLR